MRAAIRLAAIKVAAKIEHRATDRKVTNPLAENGGTTNEYPVR